MQEISPYLSILQLTDPHIMESPKATLLGINTAYYFNAVIAHAMNSAQHFDLCLVTGDLAQDPCLESYQYLFNQLQPLNIPIRCLPGNHDDFDIMQTVLCTETVNCGKRVVLGNWQIVNLNSQTVNSPDGIISTKELAFLEHCLRNHSELFTLIAVHHHCLPTGSRWLDKMIIKNARDLFTLINRYPKVKAIINGHIHQAMDAQINDVRVLSTPSTCFQFRPESATFSLDDTSPGYRWLNLYNDGSINSEVVRLPEPLIGLQAHPKGY